MTAKAKPAADISDEYKNMVDLLAVYSDASNQLAELEVEVNAELLSQMDDHRAEYSQLQEKLTQAETALELVALAHPEWFATRKSLKTPYGTVKFTRSTRLEVPNEEVALLLIKQHAEKADPEDEFTLGAFVRTAEELNLEALEKLDDRLLRQFRINRVPTQNFKIEPARVDMGKAVKQTVAIPS